MVYSSNKREGQPGFSFPEGCPEGRKICDTGGGQQGYPNGRGEQNIATFPGPIGLNPHPPQGKNEIFAIKLSNKSKWIPCNSCREIVDNTMMDEYLSHDKDNMLYCSGLDEHDHQLGTDAELHVGAVLPLQNKPANKGSKQDNNLTFAGSCDAPSESGGEEEGTLMRQEQAEDKEHTDMDCMVVMEQTRSEQVDNKTRQEARTMQEQASKMGMEELDRPLGECRALRVGPGIRGKIMELKRVGVGESGEKKRKVRRKKELPELPSYFPRIDKIISAMGGSKNKRKREKDELDEAGVQRRRRE